MQAHQTTVQGLWLPLITPFHDGELDEVSLRRLVRHFAGQPIDGLILCATTGEGITVDASETESIVCITTAELDEIGSRMPVYLGLSGSDTRKLVQTVENTADWSVCGYLITCPYYTRPSQEGLYQHFSTLAGSTQRPILIYNIPYRTGVNMLNDTMLRLADFTNIVGVKDCAANPEQSSNLLRDRPSDFAILTGEGDLFHTALLQGADGGILASAHVRTTDLARLRRLVLSDDLTGASALWPDLEEIANLLFAEPSPAPIKHWLWRAGLIDSPEVRLPMTMVTDGLANRIDRQIELSAEIGKYSQDTSI